MKFLRLFSIKARMIFLLSAFLLVLVGHTVIALVSEYDALMDAKKQGSMQLTQTAYSVMEHYHAQTQSGMPVEAAKEQAKKTIASLRYDGNYFFIFDTDVVVQMHPIKPQLQGKNLRDFKDSAGNAVFMDMLHAAQSGPKGGFSSYVWPKPGAEKPVEKISSALLFKPWGWVLGTGVYVDDIKNEMISVVKRDLIMVAIFAALLSAMAYMIIRSIAAPSNRLLARMRNIASGDGDLTMRIEDSSNDEFGKIAGFFNQFVDAIHDVVKMSKDVVSDINHASQVISEASNETEKQTAQQREQARLLSLNSEQLMHAISDVATSAEQAATSAITANDNAKIGSSHIDKTKSSVGDLASHIDRTSAVLEQLVNESNSIGKVLAVIQDVAEKTNLLALNAAIEAARAGEQGRGFAVVADEVRTLASRTQESTEEINSTIARLQDQAQSATGSITISKETSSMTVSIADETDKAIHLVTSAIDSISNMNMNTARAVEEQSKAANDMNQAIEEIVQASGAVQAISQKITDEGRLLDEHVQSLNNSINRFTV